MAGGLWVLYRSLGSLAQSAAGTSIAPPIPSPSPQAGDVMIAAVELETTTTVTISTPTGWTKVGQVQTATNSSVLAVYWRAWQSGDTAPSFTWTGSFKGCAGIIAVANASTSAPVSAFQFAAGDTAGTSAATPTINSTFRGSMRVAIVASEAVGTHTTDIRMQRRIGISSTGGTAATNNSLSISEQTGMAEGASGTRTVTIPSGKYLMCSLWIRPATESDYGLVRSALTSAAGTTTNTATLAAADRAAGAPATTCLVSGYVVAATTTTQPSAPTGFTIPTNGTAHETGDSAAYWAAGAYNLNNTATGAISVVWTTPDGAGHDSRQLLLEIAGIDPTSGFDIAAANFAASAGTSASVSLTPSSGSRYIFGVFAGDTTAMTFDSSYFPRYASPNITNATLYGQDRQYTASGSAEVVDWTGFSASIFWSSVALAFKPAAAGGTLSVAGRAEARGRTTGGIVAAQVLAGRAAAVPRTRGGIAAAQVLAGRADARAAARALVEQTLSGGGRTAASGGARAAGLLAQGLAGQATGRATTSAGGLLAQGLAGRAAGVSGVFTGAVIQDQAAAGRTGGTAAATGVPIQDQAAAAFVALTSGTRGAPVQDQTVNGRAFGAGGAFAAGRLLYAVGGRSAGTGTARGAVALAQGLAGQATGRGATGGVPAVWIAAGGQTAARSFAVATVLITEEGQILFYGRAKSAGGGFGGIVLAHGLAGFASAAARTGAAPVQDQAAAGRTAGIGTAAARMGVLLRAAGLGEAAATARAGLVLRQAVMGRAAARAGAAGAAANIQIALYGRAAAAGRAWADGRLFLAAGGVTTGRTRAYAIARSGAALVVPATVVLWHIPAVRVGLGAARAVAAALADSPATAGAAADRRAVDRATSDRESILVELTHS